MEMKAKQRILAPIPTRELERRWREVRISMRDKGIDCLIMQNDNMYLGGYVRYFTDIPAVNGYPVTVIFPVDEEMTIITHGGRNPGPPDWAIRGIKTRLAFPYFRTANYTNNWDAEATVKIIKAHKYKRVGIIGLGCMHAAYYKYLENNLPGVEIIEATDIVDAIKAVKSADELIAIKRTMEIQDIVFAAVPTIVRPGKYEYEVRTELERVLGDFGSEEQLMMLGSAPPGSPARHLHNFYQNRMIEQGDQITIMIEPSGSGGYYGELGRTWVLGEPSPELLKVWDDALAAQKITATWCKSGAKPAEIISSYNNLLTDLGHATEDRIFAHGQGYDLVERPLIREEEPMVLQAGMVIAIHPAIMKEKAFAFCCDDFLITDNGGVRMHKTPQEILVINC